MKRGITALLAVLLLLSFGASVQAAEIEKKEIDVYARYMKESDVYDAEVKGGSASVTLGDGTVISVTGITGDGIRLVVFPIPQEHTDVWIWIKSCIAPYGTDIYPLEIYFLDQDGNRVRSSETITITVTTQKKYEDPIVCYLAESGNVTVLKSSRAADQLTFETDHNIYYVLAEKVRKIEKEETTQNSSSLSNSSKPGKTPQTGDESHILLWSALALLSGSILFRSLIYRSNKNTKT